MSFSMHAILFACIFRPFNGKNNPDDIITHRLSLDQGEHAYKIFDKKDDHCIKVVLKP